MKILLQENEVGHFDVESSLIYQHCIMERIPAQKFHHQDMIDGKIDLSDCGLVVGGVPAVSAALSQLNVDLPSPNYYPEELQQFLHRKVGRGTVEDVYTYITLEQPIFAKSDKWKQMTGRVFNADEELGKLSTLPDNTPVWLSQVVEWLSEWRVYVVNGQIKACCIYEGDESKALDNQILSQAVDALSKNPRYPKCYAFDWGVLSTGETALVEMNDGWAIGAYKGIHYRDYYELLKGRWDELLEN